MSRKLKLIGSAVFLFAVFFVIPTRTEAAPSATLGSNQTLVTTYSSTCGGHLWFDTPVTPFSYPSSNGTEIFLNASVGDSSYKILTNPSLSTFNINCSPFNTSLKNPSPTSFLWREWPYQFSRNAQTGTVYANVYNEYYGGTWPNYTPPLTYSAITTSYSNTDYSSSIRSSPLITARSVELYDSSKVGFWGASTLAKMVDPHDGYTYNFFWVRPSNGTENPSCGVMRTNNPANPSSWRVWDGTFNNGIPNYTLSFYQNGVAVGLDNYGSYWCPLYVGWSTYYNAYIMITNSPGSQGHYYFRLSSAANIYHWGNPIDMGQVDNSYYSSSPGVLYVGIIDPQSLANTNSSSASSNSIIGHYPYLTYIRYGSQSGAGWGGNYKQQLVARQINFSGGTSTTPAPTATLTVNNSHNITVHAGDVIHYAWNSSNGTNWHGSYSSINTITHASCGSSNSWSVGTTASGVANGSTASFANCVITGRYTASNLSATASSTVTINVLPTNPAGPAPTANLTGNNSHSLNVHVGESLTYAWSSSGGSSFSSNYTCTNTVTQISCGSGAWIAHSAQGTVTVNPISATLVNRRYNVYYVVHTSSGSTATSSLVINILPNTPTASLTVNNSSNLMAYPGTFITYRWNSSLGTHYTSTYTCTNTITYASCGSGAWIANNANGSASITLTSFHANRLYRVYYTVTGANNISNTSSIILRVGATGGGNSNDGGGGGGGDINHQI